MNKSYLHNPIKISFVILHYQDIKVTCNCVNSILKQKNNSKNIVEIIIVDNHSPNGSGIKLKEMYKTNKNIHAILLENNIGFSKANNIGYKYAKENKSELIIMSNNDIIIEDENFLDELYEYYINNKNYYIISTDIINSEGQHQNPLRENYSSIKEARTVMLRNIWIYCMMYIPGIRK